MSAPLINPGPTPTPVSNTNPFFVHLPNFSKNDCIFQKKTKYTSSEAKWNYVNETIDKSKYKPDELKDMIVFKVNGTDMMTKKVMVKAGSDTVPAGLEVDPKGSINVLGLVVFSIVFGIVLGRIGERGMPLKAFFESLNEVIMKMVSLVMW